MIDEKLNLINNYLRTIYKNVLSEERILSLTKEVYDKYSYWNEKIKIDKNNVSLTEKDIYLITYGDSFKEENKNTLNTLTNFFSKYLEGTFNYIHILPMFPFSSDDGFSVIDYYKINPQFGNWSDIKELSTHSKLMFDWVINHISAKSEWVKSYLKGEDKYDNFFFEKPEGWDFTKVIRPRTSDLFTKFESNGEIKELWTTFSADQVDLNFREPNVLLESLDILFTYIQNGARSIRLDAIGFLWKEKDTGCMHLPQTHTVIKLWRLLCSWISKEIILITETNVPFEENISYFGDSDEAQLVYQFPLPPLTAYTLLKGNSKKINEWLKSNEFIFEKGDVSFFNFLASHDGIGMRPTEGILTNEEINELGEICLSKDGQISYKTNKDGTKSIYELNINYFSILENKKDSKILNINRFIAAQSLLVSMYGVPAIYYHSLLGSKNDLKGYQSSGIKRRINREKLNYIDLEKTLSDKDSTQYLVYNAMINLLKIRRNQSAFNPYSKQITINLGDSLIVFKRVSESQNILYILNITDKVVEVNVPNKGVDLITNKQVNETLNLKPYQFVWIESK